MQDFIAVRDENNNELFAVERDEAFTEFNLRVSTDIENVVERLSTAQKDDTNKPYQAAARLSIVILCLFREIDRLRNELANTEPMF